MRQSLARVVLVVVLAVAELFLPAYTSHAPEPADLLPYGTVMIGVLSATVAVSSPSEAGAFDSYSFTIATTAQFYPGTRIASVSLLVQLASNSTDRSLSTRELYRMCHNEEFTITTDEFGSRLTFDASHDPLSCLASFVLEVFPPALNTLLPVNLTASMHPYDPNKLMVLRLGQTAATAIKLYPAMGLPSLLRHATGGPITYLDNAAVSFCSQPGAFTVDGSSFWTLRIVVAGAYNVELFASAVSQPAAGTSAPSVVCVPSRSMITASSAPVVFRMAGGRLDIVPGRWSKAADETATALDSVNSTIQCIQQQSFASASTVDLSGYLLLVDSNLVIVAAGRTAVLKPDYCWQTPAYSRRETLHDIVGHSYAGHYGDVFVSITIRGAGRASAAQIVAVDPLASADDLWWLYLSGGVRIPTFEAWCDDDFAPVPMDTSFAGMLANVSSCFSQAVAVVGSSPWLRLQYVNGADAFWTSLYGGSFWMQRVQ
jgi:hypothetical protein